MEQILVLQDTTNYNINPKKKYHRRTKKTDLKWNQADLSGKTTVEKQTLNAVDEEIEQMQCELAFINYLQQHASMNDFYFVDIHLCVTRYMPRAPWWLQPEDTEEYSMPGAKDMPSIYNYNISSYWHFTEETDKDTTEYIKARLDWAEKYYKDELLKLELLKEDVTDLGKKW